MFLRVTICSITLFAKCTSCQSRFHINNVKGGAPTGAQSGHHALPILLIRSCVCVCVRARVPGRSFDSHVESKADENPKSHIFGGGMGESLFHVLFLSPTTFTLW